MPGGSTVTWVGMYIYLPARCRVAEYLDVHEKSDDYDDHPPALVTREVLAKFRTLEAESQEAGRQQVPSQRRQVCVCATRTTCFGITSTEIFTVPDVTEIINILLLTGSL